METQKRDTILYVCDKIEEKTDAAPAVIICPGGSYHHLGMPHEGFETAKWFNSIGIKAFVLRYRVSYNAHHYPAQLEDIQMAINHLRMNSKKYNIDKNKVGAIGFSAGGHLVTMACEFSERNELKKLGIETGESLRPDFVMPIYPVVSMQTDIGHKKSINSLLGRNRSQKRRDEFSMENPDNIPENMPPVFLLACKDDSIVKFENSVRLEKSLSEKGVDVTFVQIEKGDHGFGMYKKLFSEELEEWNDKNLLPWLKKINIFEEIF